jgi:hypothetical protein
MTKWVGEITSGACMHLGAFRNTTKIDASRLASELMNVLNRKPSQHFPSIFIIYSQVCGILIPDNNLYKVNA